MTEVNIMKAPTMGNPIYQGPQGNLSLAEAYADFAGEMNPLEIELLELPIGIRIYAVNVFCNAYMRSNDAQVKIECGERSSEDRTILVPRASYKKVVASHTFIEKPYTTRKAGEILYACIDYDRAYGRLAVSILYVVEGY
ncbi:hypothetical protein [Yersinia bercovieri]|uniref:hypothetical protein n=1 Tax=Yersinia bercovieri TaxID=634 RepID=UPI00119D0AB3|nr:hypothetical protein [Yersinia bercovieri]